MSEQATTTVAEETVEKATNWKRICGYSGLAVVVVGAAFLIYRGYFKEAAQVAEAASEIITENAGELA